MTPEEIKAARERLGLTQTELAAQLGVAQSRVAVWETGKHAAPPFLALALRALLFEELREGLEIAIRKSYKLLEGTHELKQTLVDLSDVWPEK